jgi:hypothetical protein
LVFALANEPCILIGQVVVDRDPLWDRVGRHENILGVVSRVVLQDALQDAVRFKPQLARNDHLPRHETDLHAPVVLGAHHFDDEILNGGLRHVRCGRQLVLLIASQRGMRCREQLHAIAASKGRIEAVVVDVSSDVFLGLPHRERQCLGATPGDDLVEVVPQLLVGADIAEGVGDVRVARHVALAL